MSPVYHVELGTASIILGPAARAVLAFLAASHKIDLPRQPANYALRFDGEFVHRSQALRAAWARRYTAEVDINPRIRVAPSEAFIRMGTRSNFDSGRSHDDNQSFLGAVDPAGAARALNWLLDRPTTVRHQDTAIIAWLAGDPFADPTPVVMPFRSMPEDWAAPEPLNTLHVAMLKAYPPARMHLRWYWSGDAIDAFAKLAAFDRTLRQAAPHYFRDDRLVRWHGAFAGTPRWSDMVMTVLQAVLLGDRLPDGVMLEIVRLHRKPRQLPSEPLAAALLAAWQAGKYGARANV